MIAERYSKTPEPKGELVGTDALELWAIYKLAGDRVDDAVLAVALAAQRAIAVEVEALLVSSGIGSIDEQGFVCRFETLHQKWAAICAKLGVK